MYDDAVLNDALRAAGLFSLQSEDDEGRITLDSQISSGGSNLSVGQRQILALARAIVRQSKLLILDEATSAIGELLCSSCQVTVLTRVCRLRDRRDHPKVPAGRTRQGRHPPHYCASSADHYGRRQDRESVFAASESTTLTCILF